MSGAFRCCGLAPMPSREFAPAGDLLSGRPESRQRVAPVPSPSAALRVPCDARSPGPRPTRFATLRSNKGARSQSLRLAALAPRAPALLGSSKGDHVNSQQPNPKTGCCRLFIHSPFEPAEEHSGLQPRAQHASSTDSAQLFDQSAAAGVLRGVARRAHRRAARCAAKGRADRGRLFAFFLVAQKEGRPPGRRPGMGLGKNTISSEASLCL